MAKSPDAFRTISEVADWLETKPHVLRFWESKFKEIAPVKRAGGRRYYRPDDMRLIGGIKKLLHDDGMTIKGVQKLLSKDGIAHVTALSQPLDFELASQSGSSAPQSETTSKEAANKPETPQIVDPAKDGAPSETEKSPVLSEDESKADQVDALAGTGKTDDKRDTVEDTKVAATTKTKPVAEKDEPSVIPLKPRVVPIPTEVQRPADTTSDVFAPLPPKRPKAPVTYCHTMSRTDRRARVKQNKQAVIDLIVWAERRVGR